MSQADEIKHSSYTKAGRRSEIWYDGIGANSVLEIEAISTRPIVEREFLLIDVKATRKGGHSAKNNVVFISDLHWDGWNRELYESLSKEISSLQPDYILFGGDLGVYSDTIDGAVNWLATLSARKGKYAVAGNRESCLNWLEVDFWRSAYASAGFEFLSNEVVDVGDLCLCGIDDYRFGKPDWSVLNGVDRKHTVITFTHNPDAAASRDLETYLGDIVLCGHTHGGQLCFPVIGPLYTSSEFGRQFLHGWKTRDDGTLCLVSNGIGESGFGIMRQRIRCPREFVLLRME